MHAKRPLSVLKVHPADNVIVALKDFEPGEPLSFAAEQYLFPERIPIKHKFAQQALVPGEAIIMYGVTVGKATQAIAKGARISTGNVVHAADTFSLQTRQADWQAPDVRRFQGRTFMGYHRADGRVGTQNLWLVIPLVFCENRNLDVIKAAMLEPLGYASEKAYAVDVQALVQLHQQGAPADSLRTADIIQDAAAIRKKRVFANVDGIRFLQHDGGCGGIRQDSETLCRLLAAYIDHPNVAGATVLSLGCQNAQFRLLEQALAERAPGFQKPLYILEQQKSRSERAFIAEAVKQTFIGLTQANLIERKAAGLEQLCLGLECGGSDGFSGISANPALGYTSDLLVALGGKTILSEFPELNGVEQELINRCIRLESAQKFASLMQDYAKRAEAVGSGFDMNPSPGNIKDGLITDAMKSAGAAKKGGSSPVVDVLDYTEAATRSGLSLLCTPGNDVESTTGLAGSGANLIVFTTGLGTPTGNPVAPTIKMATNNALAERMPDIIDINAGTIITGEDTIESKGTELLEYLIEVASGRAIPHAVRLGQHDFIPWKRGVSL